MLASGLYSSWFSLTGAFAVNAGWRAVFNVIQSLKVWFFVSFLPCKWVDRHLRPCLGPHRQGVTRQLTRLQNSNVGDYGFTHLFKNNQAFVLGRWLFFKLLLMMSEMRSSYSDSREIEREMKRSTQPTCSSIEMVSLKYFETIKLFVKTYLCFD